MPLRVGSSEGLGSNFRPPDARRMAPREPKGPLGEGRRLFVPETDALLVFVNVDVERTVVRLRDRTVVLRWSRAHGPEKEPGALSVT
jgi:hypothetical protein